MRESNTLQISYINLFIKDLSGLQPQHISHFFLREFISIKRALVLGGRFSSFNSLKGILSLMKIIISPLEFLSNLNSFAKS